MSNNNTYKLKYYKYKTKYNTLKQQQGGIVKKMEKHTLYLSHDRTASCSVKKYDPFIGTGAYSIVKQGIGNIVEDCIVKQYTYDKTYADKERDAEINCNNEYMLMKSLVGVPGVVQVQGQDCMDDIKIMLEEYGGKSFTCFNRLPPVDQESMRPYAKTMLSEILCVLRLIHTIYHIIHRDIKLENILWNNVRHNSETYNTFKITDFGLSSKYRDDKVILKTDPDIHDGDIPVDEFDDIPYVKKYTNGAVHTSYPCISWISLFKKDAILSRELRNKFDCRPILEMADIEPCIGQGIHIISGIIPTNNNGSYLELYDLETRINAHQRMINALQDELQWRSFDIKDGIICLKTEPGRQLSNYASIDYPHNNEQLDFLEKSYAIAQKMAGGRITTLPMSTVYDFEESLQQMRDALSIFDRQPRPFVKIPEELATATKIPIQDVAHIPPEQIIRDVYDRHAPVVPSQPASVAVPVSHSTTVHERPESTPLHSTTVHERPESTPSHSTPVHT